LRFDSAERRDGRGRGHRRSVARPRGKGRADLGVHGVNRTRQNNQPHGTTGNDGQAMPQIR
jgi:hypothetical protein